MEMFRLADNIAKFRKEKKMTQELLANFMGVTKASVSKWETKQSMPDISLLPQLATFFDVSIDELMGYEASLSKEQIQRLYMDLRKEFSTQDFDVVMNKTRKLVKKYYSCYEFLESIVCLWINHYILPGIERSAEILGEAKELCIHIVENCKDISLCKDILLMKASIDLILGNSKEVIEELEEIYHPESLFVQGESVLINAYLQEGELKKANDFTQISMYLHLFSLVNEGMQYITIHKDNLQICEKTLYRITELARIYNLEELNFNVMAVFYYQMTIIYCEHDKKREAIEQLQKYIRLSMQFLESDDNYLKEDEYFNRLDIWVEKTMLAGNIPRDKKMIYDSILLSFDTPSFEILKDEQDFVKLKNSVERFGA